MNGPLEGGHIGMTGHRSAQPGNLRTTITTHPCGPHRYGASVSSARRVALVVVVVPAVLALGACAESGPPQGPADHSAIATWAEPAGIVPELVFVTEADGFELATQSVGVFGDDAMSASYWGTDGGFTLSTWRDAPPGVALCDELPDSAAADPVARCAVERAGVHVLLEGDGVDPATLRAAGDAVRVPTEDELEHLFSGVQVAGPPVERGDLPPDGGGAPMNDPGPGG